MKVDMNRKHGRGHRKVDKSMLTWTRTLETCMRTWKYGQGHGTWTKPWQHERGRDNIDKDMATETITFKHGQGHGNMDEDMETWMRT
jgi:hypothetical protein